VKKGKQTPQLINQPTNGKRTSMGKIPNGTISPISIAIIAIGAPYPQPLNPKCA